MTDANPAVQHPRPGLHRLKERVREHEGLIRALQAGEVDAVLVLENDGIRISRLQDDEPLYRTIVDCLPQGVVTVLADGTLVYVNRHFAKLIGVPAESLRGTSIVEHVTETERGPFLSMLGKALIEPQENGFTFRWAAEEAAALVSAIRLPIKGVDAVGLVVADIRDQIARQRAEEASRTKDELLASVSHELRTPLTANMGWIELLEMELGGDQHIAEALHNLKNAVVAQTRIVDDLLDFSRSAKGSLSLDMKEFDLCETLRIAASFIGIEAQGKALSLKVELPETALRVRGDPHRLRQVFVNLLSNAVKFTPQGEITLRVRKEDAWVIAEVFDSGVGISAEFLPFVFEPFRRADRTKSFNGLGIGLAISRRLVEEHGGTIEVASDGPDRGSTFTVRLPLLQADW